MSERRIAVLNISTQMIADILGLPAGMTVRHLGLDPMAFTLHVVVEHPGLPDTAPNIVPPELLVVYERQGDGVARLQYLGLGGGEPPIVDRASMPEPLRHSKADLSEDELNELKDRFLAAQGRPIVLPYWMDDGAAEGKPL